MSLRMISLAALLAVSPFVASAATLTIDDGNGQRVLETGDTTSLVVVDELGAVTNFTVNIDTGVGDSGPYYFDLINDSSNLISISIAQGTIDSDIDETFGSYGFTSQVNDLFVEALEVEPLPSGGITITLDGQELFYPFGTPASPTGEPPFSFENIEINPNSYKTLTFDFDGVVCASPEGSESTSCPSIDFTVRTITTPIPLPAAGWLLLGGLGGLYAMRRRKS